ncbi:MAG: flippase-like domain-containing protein [Bacteroidetes bacterium]|nr:flippase-like domain-containing protein [Bacteroidota bacterium]
MQNKTKIQDKSLWRTFLKVMQWILPLFICLLLYKKFYKNTAFSFSDFVSQLKSISVFWYLLLVVSSLINWSLETYKWQILLKKFNPLSFKQAFVSVLSGVAVSQLLPYKMGEYLGRLVYVKDKNKWNAGLLSVVGSYSQLLITLVLGFISFLILKPIPYAQHFAISLGLLIVIGFFLYWFLPYFNFTKKYLVTSKLETALKLTNRKDLLCVLTISLVRYLSFLLPYSLFAWQLGLSNHAPFVFHILAVSCIFFMQTVTPNFILTDIAIRLTVPLVIFTLNGALSTLGFEYLPGIIVYIFNVVLPMIIGTLFIIFAKLKRS